VKTLRETIAEAIYRHPNRDVADAYKIADDALATFREWLEKNGLVVVPRDATQEMTGAVLDACAPRSEIMKTYAAMIAAAPDALETKP
jgi:hypothetical protein